jgi:hypothetical protein
MSQANVTAGAFGNATWYTDKAEIVTGGNPVSYNVYAVALPPQSAVGNIYSTNPQIASNSRQQIYVGAGNKLTIIGGNSTARELGTASSATAGVNATNG